MLRDAPRERAEHHAQAEHRGAADDGPVEESSPAQAREVQAGDAEVAAERVAAARCRRPRPRGRARRGAGRAVRGRRSCPSTFRTRKALPLVRPARSGRSTGAGWSRPAVPPFNPLRDHDAAGPRARCRSVATLAPDPATTGPITARRPGGLWVPWRTTAQVDRPDDGPGTGRGCAASSSRTSR